ncbi:MAG TPA: hypothetical protein DCZ40_04185 [Lachnospiraceae bacterium]|nr:hypothetical protein [Lachnospiraceae bacterium]
MLSAVLYLPFVPRILRSEPQPHTENAFQIKNPAASNGVFDPRGSRQISTQAWLLGSLPAGIKNRLYSTVTTFARFLGLSTSNPLSRDT